MCIFCYDLCFKNTLKSPLLIAVVLLTVFIDKPLLAAYDVNGGLQDPVDNKLVKNVESLYDSFRYYRLKEKEKALSFAQEAHQIASKYGDSLWIVKTGRAVGWVNSKIGYLDLSIDFYEKSLGIARTKNYKDQETYLLNSLGAAYFELGDFDQSLKYHMESLKLREEMNDKKGITISYNNIGMVYYGVGDHEKALQYYLKSLNLNKEMGRQKGVDKNYINIGLAYMALENYEEALKYFNNALAVCSGNCDDQVLMWSNYGIGKSFRSKENYDSAEVYFRKSLDYSLKTESDTYQLLNYRALASIKYEQSLYGMAIDLLDKAQVIADRKNSWVLFKENYKLYANIYEALGKYQQAYEYQGKYFAFNDSIFNQEMIKNFKDILLLDQEEKNRQLIEIKDQQISTSKQLNYLLALFVVMFSAFLIVLYVNYRQKQKTNKQLEEANATIETKNEQLSQMNTMLEDKVKERTKELGISNQALKKSNEELDTFIYRTSHDIRGPLASLLGLSEVALIDVSDEKALDYFSKLNQTANSLNEILSRVLDITQIKTASQFDEDIDFHNIIEEILEKESSLPYYDQIDFNLNIQKDLRFKSDPYLIQTIINNLVDNAYRFYNTSERIESFISLDINYEEDGLVIRVVDNGVGLGGEDIEKLFEIFSKGSKRRGTAGLGLYLVKLAVERISGEVVAETNIMGFTEFRVILPLNEKSDKESVPAA